MAIERTRPNVVVTGAARGMGRSHAERLARDGYGILAIDRCGDTDGVPYGLATRADLDDVVEGIRRSGGAATGQVADVTDLTTLKEAVHSGIDDLGGGLRGAVFNAGIWTPCSETWSLDEGAWDQMITTNLSGQWRSLAAVVPHIIESGQGGSIVFISSMNGLKASYGNGHYTAAKHGLIGLMKTAAIELAGHNIRVNALCPTGVRTPMLMNEYLFGLFRPDLDHPTFEDCEEGLRGLNLLPVPVIEPVDVSEAVAWLLDDGARYITGSSIPVDAGQNVK